MPDHSLLTAEVSGSKVAAVFADEATPARLPRVSAPGWNCPTRRCRWSRRRAGGEVVATW